MHRSHKIRLYPTKAQAVRLEQWMSVCRAVYNTALEQRWDALKKQDRWLNYFDQCNDVKGLRAEFPWIADVSASCLMTSSLKRLDTAFHRWSIQKVSKRPKFKKKSQPFSLQFGDNTRFEVRGTKIRFEKFGSIKARVIQEAVGRPRTATIYKDADHWYCGIVYEVPEQHLAQRPGSIGLDMGVTDFVADSIGKTTPSPSCHHKALKRLKKLDRALTRKKKGSNRYKKTRLKRARAHRKIRNQRHDFVHKLSTTYANSHGTVVMENLQIPNMTKNHRLARSITDQGWGKFRKMLKYKLAALQGELVLVDPKYTSQMCNVCGVKGVRSGKTFECADHGTMDADTNAARNILKKSVKTTDLGRTRLETIAEAKVPNDAVEAINTNRKVV